jgi:hypothetical protein
MNFHGRSDRIVEGHGSSFFSQNLSAVEQWARKEAKAGFKADVFSVQEVFVIGFEPLAPAAAPARAGSLCLHGHAMKDRQQCPVCGEVARSS